MVHIHDFGDFGFPWWPFGVGMILTVVFWIAVIVAVVWLVRTLAQRPAGGVPPAPTRPPGPDAEALAILERRFAEGEIDEEEFQRRRQALLRAYGEQRPAGPTS